jgi:predicted secreted protein
MTTSAKIGFGNLFKIGNGATPEVFTTVAEVTGIKPPKMKRDTVDATHMQSPNGWREFIAGLKDGGEVSVELNFVPGSATTILLMAELDAALGNKQIVFSTGEVFSFTALCTDFEPTSPLDDKMSATAMYKISGQPTLA